MTKHRSSDNRMGLRFQRLERSSPPSSSQKEKNKKNAPHSNFGIKSAALAVFLMTILSSTVVVEAVSMAAITTDAATTTPTTTSSHKRRWLQRQLQQQRQRKQLVVIAGPHSSGSMSMYKFLDRYASAHDDDGDDDNDNGSDSNRSKITGWNWPAVSSNDMATIADTTDSDREKKSHEVFDYLFSDSSSSSRELDDVKIQQILLKSIRDAWTMTTTEGGGDGSDGSVGGVFLGSDEFERVGSTSTSTTKSSKNDAALSVLFRIKENLSIPSNEDITIVLFFQSRRVDQLSRLISEDETSSGPDPQSYEDFICSVHEDDTSGKWNYLDVSMVRFVLPWSRCVRTPMVLSPTTFLSRKEEKSLALKQFSFSFWLGFGFLIMIYHT